MDCVYAEIIAGLTSCYKVLRVVEPDCRLADEIEKLITACKEEEAVTPAVVKEIIVYHAIRGDIERCVRLIQENEKLLLQSVVYFDYCMSILVSTLARSPGVIKSVFDCPDEKGKRWCVG